jgi:hypothetical protein
VARYTLELREILDNNIDIFNGWEFPIFDEAYRTTLKEKIINHYKFREIGVETTGRFIHNLKTRMQEVMPYYNKMYLAMALEQRILDNYDVTETYTRVVTDDNTSGSKRLFSDTPQGRVTLLEQDANEFITQVNDDTQTETNTNNEDWTRTMKGNIGIQTDADAVTKYMESIVNVDLLVINSLNDLFMGIY